MIVDVGPLNRTFSARRSGSSAATDNAWPVPPVVGGVAAFDVGGDVDVAEPGEPLVDDSVVFEESDDSSSPHDARNALAAPTEPQMATRRASTSRRFNRPSSPSSTISEAAYRCIQFRSSVIASAFPYQERTVRRHSAVGAKQAAGW